MSGNRAQWPPPRRSAWRFAIPASVVRLSVGFACAVLAILLELGLDEVVDVAPWLVVPFAFGLIAAVLGGVTGGLAAAGLDVAAQLFVVPARYPAVERMLGTGWPIDVVAALAALVLGLWIRTLIIRPPDLFVVPAGVRSGRGGSGEPAPPPRDSLDPRPPRPGASADAGRAGGSAPAPAGDSTSGPAPGPGTDLEGLSVAVRDIAAARTPVQIADTLARHAATLTGAAGAVVYLGKDGADGFVAAGRHGAVDPAAPEQLVAPRGAAVGGGSRPSAGATRAAGPKATASARSAAAGGPTGNGADGTDDDAAGSGARRDSIDRAAGEGRIVECPIGLGGATFGMLRLNGAATGRPPRHGPLVDVIVQVAADSIERGRLLSTRRVAEADASGAVGRLAILARLAAELVGATSVEEVARTLVDLAVDDLAAGFAALHVPDGTTDVFTMVHARGYPAGLLAADRSIGPGTGSPVGRAVEERSVVEIVGEDGWRAAFPAASNVPAITGVRAITAIPMQAGGLVHGVLSIGWRTTADRGRIDHDLLATAADQGAQALERALLHAHDQDARRFQEAFIGVVSHELRTPITTILAGSRLLRRRLDDDSRSAELSDDIEIEADRLSRIVDDLLVLSRLERRHLTIGDEPVHLDHLLARVLRSETMRWPEHRIRVVPSRGSHVVLGDETYVEQVIRNLLSNAAKYSPMGSLVEVAIDDAPDGDVHVRVLDEGPGVAPAEVDDLFSLFYRSPSTAASAAGAGIGLFVSRRLVAEMGGRMWARPRKAGRGGGSEFGFSLVRYPIEEAEFDDTPPGWIPPAPDPGPGDADPGRTGAGDPTAPTGEPAPARAE